MKKMKVLHLPTSTGGNAWGLSQAEKKLGLDSKVLVDVNNWLNYKSDYCLNLENKNKIEEIFIRIKAFIKIRNKYDVYHFNFGSSLIDFMNYGVHLWDLPFYKGKKIMTYNGRDARQDLNLIKKDFIGEIYNTYPNNDIKRNLILKKKIEKVAKNVDHIFSLNPDLMHFLPKEKTTFLPYTIAEWDSIKRVPYIIEDKIKIIHSPTNRAIKGSDYIIEALNNLTKKHTNIEVEIIENIPYQEALIKYKEAHLVIDQVLIGWYGAFAVEVMKMAKPLAVFIREEDLAFIPEQMSKDLLGAVININQNNIENVLELYINNIELLHDKSNLSYEYAQKWHNPIDIAKKVKEIYEA
jgi:hypothetical protein